MYGQRIKELRLERGWSQKELADKLNIAQMTVSKYELEDRDLSTATLTALCHIFEVTSDYLLGLEDESGAKTYR